MASKNTIRNKYIYLLAINVLSILQSSLIASDQSSESPRTAHKECYESPLADDLSKDALTAQAAAQFVDSIIDTSKKQLDDLFGTLSMLSTMISEGQVPTIKNKKDAIEAIKSLTYLIQNIQQERFVNADFSTAHFLLEVTNALTQHIHAALKDGCKTIKAFNLDTFSTKKRSSLKEVTPESLQKKVIINAKELDAVKKAADLAGLRWRNLAYRKFDKYIVEPCQKYSLMRRMLDLTYLTGMGLYAYWYLDQPGFAEQFPRLGKLMGKRPGITMHDTSIDYSKSGPVAIGESMWSQSVHSNIPLFTLMWTSVYAGAKREWENHLEPWLSKKMSVITNKLKGGQYVKQAKKAAEQVEDVSFDDLVGADQVKHEFAHLVGYLENPESYDRMGATPPKGILLIGDTRTGKSFSVKALFGEISRMLKRNQRKDDFKFLEFNASEINQHGIAYLMNLVNVCAPCVVFIDEIDLLDLQRKGKNEALSQWLTVMSGTIDKKDPKNQVIIIAATNRPENLDKALRQPGRFGKELRFEYPTAKDRKTFILRQLDKLSLNPQFFDIEGLVGETEGKSFEALKMLINTAIIKARTRGQGITQEHIQEALDEVLHHIIPADSKDISPEKKQLLSIHFAGHALMLSVGDKFTNLSKVTIRQVMTDIKEEAIGMHLFNPHDANDNNDLQKHFEYGAVFTHENHDPINVHTREEKLAMCRYHLAGIVAEEIIFGACGYSCHTKDMEKALSIAQSIAFQGLEVSRLPKHIQKQMYDEALALRDQCKKDVADVLNAHKNALLALASCLTMKETLSGQEVEMIINVTENPELLQKLMKEAGIDENGKTITNKVTAAA